MRSAHRVIRLLIVSLYACAGLTGCSSDNHSGSPVTPNSTSASAASECAVTAAPANGMSAPPEGLIAFKIYQPGAVPFPSEVFSDASVSGVDLYAQWSNLEPKPGAPLVLSASSQTATSVTVTAVTDLLLDPVEMVNIYKGTMLIRTCPTSTCSVSVQKPLGPGPTVYKADVGAPGTPPYSTQSVVSATTTVSSS
jgi:hypothetical protein